MQIATPAQALRLLRLIRFLATCLFLIGLGVVVLGGLLILDAAPDGNHVVRIGVVAGALAIFLAAVVERVARPHELRLAAAMPPAREPRGFEVVLYDTGGPPTAH